MKIIALLIAVSALLSGCSTFQSMSDSDVQVLFDTAITQLRERMAEKPEDPKVDTYVDAVDYSTFQWIYGGFNGSGSILDDTARISNLKFNPSTLYYTWITPNGCQDLGATSPSEAGATLACLFVKTSTGQWVGGKFDWISTSRTSRGLSHCYNYNGWKMDDIPNPCEAAFVIVSFKTGTRSNVITGAWKR